MGNTMNTFMKWLVGVAVIILIVAGIWFYVRPTPSPTPESTQTQGVEFPTAGSVAPTAPGVSPSAGTGISITAADGSVIRTNDFINDPRTVKDPVNAGYYNLGATTSASYLITYIASTQYFNVELLQEPIGTARALAEQYLEQLLGISTDDLCRINYTVSVPTNINAFYSSRDLGFSFCPGATQLPQ